MKPVTVGPFLGMNNRLPAEKLHVAREGDFVRSAVNGDFTAAGTFRRRKGSELSVAGGDCHSLWANGSTGFVIDYATLYRLDAALTREAIATVTPGLPFSYAVAPGVTYGSNGVQFFRLGETAEDVGVPMPNLQPSVTSGTGGALTAGIYRVVVSHSSPDGQEGGSSYPVAVEVPAHGTLAISDIAQLAGYATNLYITPPNGDEFYLADAFAGPTRTFYTAPVQGPRPTGLLMVPMPAGTIVRYLNGRLFTVQGNVLLYSEPHNLELHNPAKGYIQFPEPITMVEPCQNGFYISADQTYWVGGDVASAELVPVLPYKAVAGTSGAVPNSNDVWWMSERGIVTGSQDGAVTNMQEKAVAVTPGNTGASVFREEDGEKQMITTMFNPQQTVMAARSFMDAEVIRKEETL